MGDVWKNVDHSFGVVTEARRIKKQGISSIAHVLRFAAFRKRERETLRL